MLDRLDQSETAAREALALKRALGELGRRGETETHFEQALPPAHYASEVARCRVARALDDQDAPAQQPAIRLPVVRSPGLLHSA